MDWTRDLPTWPLNHLSRQIACAPHRWHVQETGTGPTILLLHGAGASTHTWRDLIPQFAAHHHVVALDLPGQGFTRPGARDRFGLDGMTADIATLCRSESWRPTAIVGHSAGACIALSLAQILTKDGTPPAVIGINAALSRFDGVAGWLFPLLAKLLALNPLTALAFSAGPNPQGRARRLIQGTGSRLDAQGLDLYARLIADRAHVDGALRMMAAWDIDRLLDTLPTIQAKALFIAADGDKAVPPGVSAQAQARMPNAELHRLTGLGHLAHEEAPDAVASLILDWISGG